MEGAGLFPFFSVLFPELLANWANPTANTFLDSFVPYRHDLGVPASVINVGVMEDVGYVSQNTAVLEMFRAYSMHGLQESDLLRAVEIVIEKSYPVPPTKERYCNRGQLSTGLASIKSITDLSNRAVWKEGCTHSTI